MEPKHITAPLDQATIDSLHAGDHVLISGTLLTARDAAHKRLVEALDRGEPLPVDLTGQVVYYVGPAPAKTGTADRLGRPNDERSARPLHARAPRSRDAGHDR